MSVVLCKEKNSRVSVNVVAEISHDCLKISGQDFGSACKEVWGKNEYEYSYTFDERGTELLYGVLSNGVDVSNLMDLVVKNFSGVEGCAKLQEICKVNNIPYLFFPC